MKRLFAILIYTLPFACPAPTARIKIDTDSPGREINSKMYGAFMKPIRFFINGSKPEFIFKAGGFKKLRHAIVLAGTAASTTFVNKAKDSLDFVPELCNVKPRSFGDGYSDPFYDRCICVACHYTRKYQIM